MSFCNTKTAKVATIKSLDKINEIQNKPEFIESNSLAFLDEMGHFAGKTVMMRRSKSRQFGWALWAVKGWIIEEWMIESYPNPNDYPELFL